MKSEGSEGLHEATKALTASGAAGHFADLELGFAAIVLIGRTNSRFCGDALAASSTSVYGRKGPSVMRAAASLHLYR